MRAVRLDEADWFSAEATKQQLDFLLENKSLFEALRQEQGTAFLVKFVINLRGFGVNSEQIWAPESDMVFTNLIKMLLDKRFEKFQENASNLQLILNAADFLPDFNPFLDTLPAKEKGKYRRALGAVFGELRTADIPKDEAEATYLTLQMRQCLSMSLRCAAALVHLATNWSNAQEGNCEWNAPIVWTHATRLAEPFETYLRARWGHKLSALLGLQVDELGWFEAPTRPKGTKIEQVPSIIPAAAAFVEAATSAAVKPKRKQKTVKQQKEEASWLLEQSPNTGDVLSFNPIFDSGTVGEECVDFFEKCPLKCRLLRHLCDGNVHTVTEEKWKSQESTLRPPLTGNYGIGHAITGKEAELLTWSCLWQQTSCKELQWIMQHMHFSLDKVRNVRLDAPTSAKTDAKTILGEWMELMSRTSDNLTRARNQRVAKFEALTASEVLLPIHLLAQLPWNNSLLRNWIVAALITIHKFEVESLELRHWPMFPDIEQVARELLCLICHAKERVLFALMIYCKQVLAHPDGPNYCKVLLEDGILPALPALEILCSGEAAQLLSEIKSFTWGRPPVPKDLDTMICMNPKAYTCLPLLENIYVSVNWHVRYWLPIWQHEPIPEQLLNAVDPNKLRGSLSKGDIPPPKTGISMNAFSIEEQLIFNLFFGDGMMWLNQANDEKRASLIMESLKRMVYLGWFTKAALLPVEEILMQPVGCMSPEKEHQWKSVTMQIVLYAMYYFRFRSTLHGSHKKQTEYSWLISMCCEGLEREQLVRAAQCVCHQVAGVAPTLQATCENPRDPPVLLEVVRAVAKKRQEKTITWFWRQFPEYWQKPVKVHQMPEMDNVSKTASELVSHFEARLGAVLGSVVRESPLTLDCGGCEFPNWPVVQCIMPIYIGTLTLCVNNITALTNFAKLLHQLMCDLEEKFQVWVSGLLKVNKASRGTLLDKYYRDSYDAKTNDDLSQIVAIRLQKRIDNILYAYVGRHLNLKQLPGFSEIQTVVNQHWNQVNTDMRAPGEILTFNSWNSLAIQHTMYLVQACQKAWKMPNPEPVEGKVRSFKNLYFFSRVMENVYCVSDMFLKINDRDYNVTTNEDWQRQLMVEVSQMEDRNNLMLGNSSVFPNVFTKNPMMKTFDEKTGWDFMTKAFKSFRSLRENIDETYFMHPLLELEPPSVKNAIRVFCSGNATQLNKLEVLLRIRSDRVCSNKKCKAVENAVGRFTECEKCISACLQHPAAFCNKKCEDSWWKLDHMAFHLERELGLE